MNSDDRLALETQPAAKSGGKLAGLLSLGNVISLVTIVPAFFYPYLLMYLLLLLGTAIALAVFLVVIQMPVFAVARVIERGRIESPRGGERFEV